MHRQENTINVFQHNFYHCEDIDITVVMFAYSFDFICARGNPTNHDL